MSRKDSLYVELLEAAYDVSADPERFDDLVSIAKSYFFGDQSATIRTDLPRNEPARDSLESRMAYLAQLLEEQLANPVARSAETFHARLSVSARSLLVTGNQAAAELVGKVFPCQLSDLPFDRQTIRQIELGLRSKVLRTSAQSSPTDHDQDRIFLTMIEEPEPRSCLALIERPKEEDGNVEIAISYIYWSHELLERLKEAFQLTSAQASVLHGFLNNKTQKTIAEERDVSVETVRDHSRAILQKTNCSRMSDVVHISASIAYMLRHYQRADDAPSLSEWRTPEDNLQLLSRTQGRSMAWYEYGSGSRPILFVHGYIQGPYFSQRFLNRLQEIDCRILAPSRPGYGYSSPSSSRANFDATVVDDALALVEAKELDRPLVVAHQGGTSHAIRIANAMAVPPRSLLMIDGGIPIDEKRYLEHMNDFARIGAVACRHAPSVMALLMNLGLPIQKMRGVEKFLREYHKGSPLDLKSIENPEIMRLNAYGVFHSMEQGTEAWVRDGASAMAEWSDDFSKLNVPQYWLHPKHCPVMGAHFVEEYLEKRSLPLPQIVPDAAFNILYCKPDLIIDFLASHLN